MFAKDSTKFYTYNYVPEYLNSRYPDLEVSYGGNTEDKDLLKEQLEKLNVLFTHDEARAYRPPSFNPQDFKNLISPLSNIVNKWSGIAAILLTFLSCALGFRYILLLLYERRLEVSLEQYHHQWMGENNLSDIMVSINIQNDKEEGAVKSYDLINFFQKKFGYTGGLPYLILGNAGEGKTISLIKLADFLCQNRIRNAKKKRMFPILLYFYDIKTISSEEDLLKCILQKMDAAIGRPLIHVIIKHFENYFARIIANYIRKGQLVLLVDGYDEINREQRFDVANTLNHFLQTHPGLFLIMTSRIAVYKEEKYLRVGKDECLFLSNFNRKQVELFLHKWEFPEGKSRRKLYDYIMRTPHLERLSKNPLLLTLITYLYLERELKAPINTTDFYLASTSCLTETWEQEKGILKRFDIRRTEKLNLLSYLAFYLFQKNQVYVTELEMAGLEMDYHSRYGRELDKGLEEVYQESGILEKRSDGSYKFYHRSFQEYFVARYMLLNGIELQLLCQDVRQNSQILLFYLSLSGDNGLVEAFIKSHMEYEYLVGQILQECAVTDMSVVDTWVEEGIRHLQSQERIFYTILGSIIAKYPQLQEKTGKRLLKLFETKEFKEFRNHILVAILYFSDQRQAIDLLENHLHKTNLAEMLKDSDQEVMDLIQELLHHDLDGALRWSLTESLAKNDQFYPLLNLFLEANSDEKRMYTAMGLLHMSGNQFFYSWLNEQNLMVCLPHQIQKIVAGYSKYYGWKGEFLEERQINNRFVLVYYACLFLDLDYGGSDLSEIENRMKYLITYVKNDTEGTLRNYMVDIPNFTFKSMTEFQYHWKHVRGFMGLECNPNVNRHLLLGSFATCLLLFMTLYLLQCYIPFENMVGYNTGLFYKMAGQLIEEDPVWAKELLYQLKSDFCYGYRWNINFHSIGRINRFDGEFLFFLAGWFGASLYAFHQLIEREYNRFSKLIDLLAGEILLIIFFIGVQNLWYRICASCLMGLIVWLFIKKHKNNYPSFRNPQYRRIRQYLYKQE